MAAGPRHTSWYNTLRLLVQGLLPASRQLWQASTTLVPAPHGVACPIEGLDSADPKSFLLCDDLDRLGFTDRWWDTGSGAPDKKMLFRFLKVRH